MNTPPESMPMQATEMGSFVRFVIESHPLDSVETGKDLHCRRVEQKKTKIDNEVKQ
jgi:hypothetical protein